MRREAPHRAEMVHWDYGRPPSAFDLARNDLISRAVRIAVHVALRGYLRLFHGLRPHRNAQLGRLRGHLIVANHSSHLDVMALLSAFPLRKINTVRSLCAKDYFSGSPLKQRLAFFLGNALPMDRHRFDRRAVSCCREEMRQGANVILFPEGTRSPDGGMGPFKAGVGLLALEYKLPVLPAFIKGAYECCDKGTPFPHPGRIEVVFGRSVRYSGPARRKRNWVAVARDLRRRVSQLWAQLRQERPGHEHATDQGAEVARSYAGQAE